MKVLTAKKRAYIYPFMAEDSADPILEQKNVLIIESNGLIRVSLNGKPAIDLKVSEAKALIAALAQAVKLAQDGTESYQQRQGPEWVEPGRGES